jgi:hypothetical protein
MLPVERLTVVMVLHVTVEAVGGHLVGIKSESVAVSGNR